MSSYAVTQRRPTSIIGLDSMSCGCMLLLDDELRSGSHPGQRLTGQYACGRLECDHDAGTPISTCLPKATTTTIIPDTEKNACVFRHALHWLAGVCVENLCVTSWQRSSDPQRTRRSRVPVPTSPEPYHRDGKQVHWSTRVPICAQQATKGFYSRLALFIFSCPWLDPKMSHFGPKEGVRGLGWEIRHRSSRECRLSVC